MSNEVTTLKFTGANERLLCARVSAFLCEPHLHNTFTIGMMRRGTAQFQIRGKTYSASPGDLFLIHPFEVHSGGDSIDGIEYDVIYPNAELMSDVARMSPKEREFPYFDCGVIQNSSRTGMLFDAVAAYEADDHRPKSSVAIEQALCGIFGRRARDVRTTGLPQSEYLAVQAACELLQDFHDEPVDFVELAQRVGFSRYHFIRVFQKATGLTPGAFLRQIRLSRARDLIAQGGDLADVAADVGFADQAHMTREFRRTYGFTPGQLALGLRPSLKQ
jgi:AraC-like DNA-binding protein